VDGILSAIACGAREFAAQADAPIYFWQLTLLRLSHTIPHVAFFDFLAIAEGFSLPPGYKSSTAASPAK
jgi:hypothetical protein